LELDQEITFTTDEGYEYLIRFTEFPQDNFEYNIHIMDVSLILMVLPLIVWVFFCHEFKESGGTLTKSC